MNNEVDITFYDERHFLNRRDKLSRKHKDEVSSAIINFFNAMNFFNNSNVEQFRQSKLVRAEKKGILAVDQKGSSKRPPYQIRLYFFPWEDEKGKHCVVFTIGDKGSQERDNNFCAEKLKKLRGKA